MSAIDPWRPRLHFSPARHWINDPNGLIWHAGEYHLFFQHNPQAREWGHMSWGHAVSTDLLHWRELPLAIAEDVAWSIFSGSAVVDATYSSGLGDGRTPPLVACYTGASRGQDGLQTQQLAYSLDAGRSFHKHGGNPVLDESSTGFRDPKVFWHAETARWVMLVSWADEGRLGFYASTNLLRWWPLSTWQTQLPAGCKTWECPDLLQLPVEGEPGHHAWVLKFDLCAGHPGGGSGALVVVGQFNGTTFRATQAPQWVDGGRDFYAAIIFAAMPPGDQRCVWLGWMNDHRYAQNTPTTPWCGAMTLPRELRLGRGPDGLRLLQQPVSELAAWRGMPVLRQGVSLPAGRTELLAPGALPVAQDIELDIEADVATPWTLGLRAGPDEATRVGVDRTVGALFIDRGQGGVDLGLAGWAQRRTLPWPGARAGRLRLRVVVDACSVEVFAGDGEAVLTELVFPRAESTGLWLEAAAPLTLHRFCAWPLADPHALPP